MAQGASLDVALAECVPLRVANTQSFPACRAAVSIRSRSSPANCGVSGIWRTAARYHEADEICVRLGTVGVRWLSGPPAAAPYARAAGMDASSVET